MAQQSIVIVVTENGSRVVQRSLQGIGQSAHESAFGVEHLSEALAAIGIGLTIRELVDASDTFQNLQNRLVAVGTSTQDLNAVYSRLTAIALETHNSIETTVNLYARLEQGVKSLGFSQNEVLKFTENLSAAFALSGASSQELKYAIQDLAHGISAGTVNGRELNGILRETPSVALYIAEALKVPVGSLRMMAKEGKITAEALIKGFNNISQEILAKLSGRVLTVKMALTDLDTKWINFIGSISKANGIGNTLAKMLETIGDNLNYIGGALVGLGSGFTVFVILPKLIDIVTGSVVRLTLAILANPLLALLSAVVAITSALVYFRDEINLGIDATTSLGDLMRAAWEQIGPILDQAKHWFASLFESISQSWTNAVGNMTNLDWLILMARGLEGFGIGVKLEVDAIAIFFKTLWYGIGSMFDELINSLLRGLDFLVNQFSEKLSGLADFVGVTIGKVKIDLTFDDPFLAGLAQTASDGAAAGAAFSKGFKDATEGRGGLETAIRGLVPRAQEIGNERAKAAKDQSDLDAHGLKSNLPVDPKAAKEAEKLQKALETIENKYDHILKYVNEYNKAVKTVTEAVAKGMISQSGGNALLQEIKDDTVSKILGAYNKSAEAAHKYRIELRDLKEAVAAHLISQEQANAAMAVATERAKDQINPLGKIIDDIKRNIAVTREHIDAQHVDNELEKYKDALLRDGIILTKQQTDGLKALVREQQISNQASDYRNQVLEKYQKPLKDLQTGTKVLNDLLKSGSISIGQYAQELNALQTAADKTDQSISGGLAQAFDKLKGETQDVAGNVSNIATKAVDGLADAFVKMASGGKAAFADLAKSIIADIEKMIIKMIEFAALKAALNAVSGNTLGNALGAADSASGGGISGSMPAPSGGGGGSTPGFATGGSFMVGGSGGTDSQMVAFRASPDERVTISRPGEHPGQQQVAAAPAQVHVKVINSMDPRETLAAMRSSEGERLILNTISRNPNAVRAATA